MYISQLNRPKFYKFIVFDFIEMHYLGLGECKNNQPTLHATINVDLFFLRTKP